MRNEKYRLNHWLLLFLVLPACSSVEEAEREDAALTEAIQVVKETYAPDQRLAVFDVSWKREGGALVLEGEVDNANARDEVLKAVRSIGWENVVDRILALPDPRLGDNQFGIVNVSVGNVRRERRHSAELVTQVLMGTKLRLLKRTRGWYYVQSPDRYLGWLEGETIDVRDEKGVSAWMDAPKVVVTGHFGFVRESPSPDGLPISDIVIGAMLKKSRRNGAWMGVELPDGRKGFIERSSVQDFDTWIRTRKLTGANIEAIAKRFLGIPYLWGGTSAKGFDCSGFTKTVFWLNGMELTRDANQQVKMGEEVPVGEDFQNLKKGDLLFFGRKATDDKPERIVHVGIYIGNKEFIHASPPGVQISSLDSTAENFDEFNLKRFVRARGIVKDEV